MQLLHFRPPRMLCVLGSILDPHLGPVTEVACALEPELEDASLVRFMDCA